MHTWPDPSLSWAQALDSWPVVQAALSGQGPAVCPQAHLLPDCELADDAALLIGTSGSTGTPKFAQLSAAALQFSVEAVHAHLGGPGQWLLCVPPSHITGFQVILRSHAAGHPPVALAPGPFTPQSFAEGVARLDARAPYRYTTLVPTQLVRLLADEQACMAARSLDAVLIGGAPLSRAAAEQARSLGLRLCIGYGTSETAGGCVYDGKPIPGASARIDKEGRVSLGGPMVASGYAGRPDLQAGFTQDGAGTRWFRTDDLGEIDAGGRLRLHGRADDIINTGGLKVAPRAVEEAITDACPQVSDALVVGLPDRQWGQVVAAALVLAPGADTVTCAHLREVLDLPRHALPRLVQIVAAIPTTGPGKPDRAATVTLLSAAR